MKVQAIEKATAPATARALSLNRMLLVAAMRMRSSTAANLCGVRARPRAAL